MEIFKCWQVCNSQWWMFAYEHSSHSTFRHLQRRWMLPREVEFVMAFGGKSLPTALWAIPKTTPRCYKNLFLIAQCCLLSDELILCRMFTPPDVACYFLVTQVRASLKLYNVIVEANERHAPLVMNKRGLLRNAHWLARRMATRYGWHMK